MNLIGSTVADGRFVIEKRIEGGLMTDIFVGRDQRSGRAVHVGTNSECSGSVDKMRDHLSYDVPGVAKCLYIGREDGAKRDSERMFVVEEMPDGNSLFTLEGRPSNAECLGIARQVATIIAAAAAKGLALGGIQPTLVYLDRVLKVRVVPRSHVVGSTVIRRKRTQLADVTPFAEKAPFFDVEFPEALNALTEGDVYCWGLLTSWLFEGKHPFLEVAIRERDWLFPMLEGVRDPFTGPAAIGRILDRVLLVDPGKRIAIDELIGELDAVRLD